MSWALYTHLAYMTPYDSYFNFFKFTCFVFQFFNKIEVVVLPHSFFKFMSLQIIFDSWWPKVNMYNVRQWLDSSSVINRPYSAVTFGRTLSRKWRAEVNITEWLGGRSSEIVRSVDDCHWWRCIDHLRHGPQRKGFSRRWRHWVVSPSYPCGTASTN